jgi:hypothetical protein
MRNANTVRTTNSDVNKFKDWSKEQNEDRDSHEILSAEQQPENCENRNNPE